LAGLALAWIGVDAFAALSPPELPRIDSIAIDGRVLVFAIVITLGTAVLTGLVPALRFSRPDVVATLRSEARSATASRERIRLRGGLVVSEIALAIMLLIGAGLLVRSFVDLLNNDLGFATENRASIQVFVYDDIETVVQRLQRVAEYEESIRSVPGVLEVGITSALPFHPSRIDPYDRLAISGRPQRPGEEEQVLTTVASPEYFRLMAIPVIFGRAFTPEDRMDAPAVAIINESLARRFFPNEDPIGRRVTFGVMSRPFEREIVGVVGDVRPTAFDSEPQPEIFVPHMQRGYGGVTFVIRTEGDPASLLPVLQQKIWEVFPRQSIYHAGKLDDLVSATLVERRFHLVVLASFSLVALILATIGIYGLIAFSTSQRTGEIGVRVALGARPTDVVGLIVRQALRLALPGITLGVAGALLLTRFMERMLYGVTPTDFATFAQITVLMLIVTAVASFLPARRAAAADPVAALREE
jgi:putative ABC transport system permease protein